MNGIALHLMRHGAPVRPGLMLGHTDDAPLAAGIDQCVARAAGLEVEAVGASDLARAVLPAMRIAEPLGLVPQFDVRWRELSFGQWDGQAPETLPREALARFWQDPDRNPPPSGETWSLLRDRVGMALAGIDRPTLVVAHGGSIRAALAILLGLDHRQVWGIDLPYGALVSLRLWPGAVPVAQLTGLQT